MKNASSLRVGLVLFAILFACGSSAGLSNSSYLVVVDSPHQAMADSWLSQLFLQRSVSTPSQSDAPATAPRQITSDSQGTITFMPGDTSLPRGVFQQTEPVDFSKYEQVFDSTD